MPDSNWFQELFVEEAKKALYNRVGSGSGGEVSIGDTIILVDENGTEVAAVLTNEEVDLTATANDIRKGVSAVTDEGIVTGTKEIPTYHTTEGYKVIANGAKFTVTIDDYDYTKLQAIFCPYNTTVAKSVVAEKVAIDGSVYAVRSAVVEASIVKDSVNGKIDFGFTNNTGSSYVIRYFSYKEIY